MERMSGVQVRIRVCFSPNLATSCHVRKIVKYLSMQQTYLSM